MRIKLTAPRFKPTTPVPGGKPFAMHAEVVPGEIANAIREAARKFDCSIFDINIKLESPGNA